jgi:hypothetical protein
MKPFMKTLLPLVTLIVLASLVVLAGDNQPTPDPMQPGHASPVYKTTAGLWVNTNVVHAMMARPTTNRPAMLLPPTGLHVQMK